MRDLAALCPAGAQTYSKAPGAYPANAPRRALAAQGAYVRCDDGRAYIDCVSALGAIVLGHGHEAVENAALAQARRGVSLSLPTEPEHVLAEKLVKLLPGADMVRFGKNGADVVNAAVRIARAHTGRDYVLRNGYHGHSDWCVEHPKSGGVLTANVARRNRVEHGDVERIAALIPEAAAVVLDPCPAEDPRDPGDGYFPAVRELCDLHGTVLVFDEMVTGFRAGWPGYPTGVEPDLWCGAKALGNGWPITVLAGREHLMRRLERDVFYSTTFAGEAVSIAAAIACLDEMERVGAATVVQTVGRAIRQAYTAEAFRLGLALRTWVESYDARPVFRFADGEDRRVFLEAATDAGLLIQGYINVTVAHAAIVERIVGGLTAGLHAVAERKVTEAAA